MTGGSLNGFHLPMRPMTPSDPPPDDDARRSDANVVDPAVLAERRAQRAELAEQVAVRRASDAQALAAELAAERARLEAELEAARREPERLSRLVAERERALRASEQRAHGEEAQRIELNEALSERTRRFEAELAELRARAERAEAGAATELTAERRVEQARAEAAEEQRAELAARLERAEALAQEQSTELAEQAERSRQAAARAGSELGALRARATEAEQVAAAAESARRRAEAKRAASREKRRRAIEERELAEAELAAARAEADAAREGADAVLAEVAHEQAEREALRAQLAQARAERDSLRHELERTRHEHAHDAPRAAAEPPAPVVAATPDGGAPGAPADWAQRLRAELSLARAAAAVTPPIVRDTGPELPPGDPALPGQTPASDPTGPRSSALERERRMVERRAAEAARQPGAARGRVPLPSEGQPFPAERRGPERAISVTALALERERSGRLQTQLERHAATERELREQIVELERAVASRMDAEVRIEGALRRVRGELEAANALRMLTERGSPTRSLIASDSDPSMTASTREPSAAAAPPVGPAPAAGLGEPSASAPAGLGGPSAAGPAPGGLGEPPAPAPAGLGEPPAAGPAPAPPADASGSAAPDAAPAASAASEPAPALAGFDANRLNAARERLRANAPQEPAEPDTAAAASAPLVPAAPVVPKLAVAPLPVVPARAPEPWLPDALRQLAREDPETAGRILVGMLPAQGLVAQRSLSYDLVLADRGTVAVDVVEGRTHVRARDAVRPSSEVDFRVATSHAGLARLLLSRRGLRRRARVRGSRKRLRELRRLAREPLALRDLAASGSTLEPALALWLAALAIDSSATFGHRFTIAHAPLPGGPADAWLRIQHGAPLTVLRTRPGEDPIVTLRCTRGALLALLAGVAPPPGEGAAIDGDLGALERVRAWIRATEFPGA